MNVNRTINAFVCWINPQQGVIAILEQKIRAQDNLILNIKTYRQNTIHENGKLLVEIARVHRENENLRTILRDNITQ